MLQRGIALNPKRVDKVKNYPVSTTVRQVLQALHLRIFWSVVCTHENRTVACQEAFDKLKELLVKAPVLAYPQFGDQTEFALETDASKAAVLSQKQGDGVLYLVAYASRKLQSAEENYAITELETLGLVWVAKCFRPYLTIV